MSDKPTCPSCGRSQGLRATLWASFEWIRGEWRYRDHFGTDGGETTIFCPCGEQFPADMEPKP